MRAVATELSLTTMALYRYVNDRVQLERLVVDLVLADSTSIRHAPSGKSS